MCVCVCVCVCVVYIYSVNFKCQVLEEKGIKKINLTIVFFLVFDLFLNRKDEDSRDNVFFPVPSPYPGSRVTWGL